MQASYKLSLKVKFARSKIINPFRMWSRFLINQIVIRILITTFLNMNSAHKSQWNRFFLKKRKNDNCHLYFKYNIDNSSCSGTLNYILIILLTFNEYYV